MKIPLRFLAFFLCTISMGWAQPFGLTNRVANTTLRMPLAPTPIFNYRIPPDNPYVGATSFNGLPVNSNSVRTEFYAVGLRNPWRYSFDPVTGLLYLADVGQGAREEVDVIYKGGNYGWAYREGLIAGPKAAQAPPGFTHIDPVQDYPRSEGFSVTGGVVYRGSRIPALYGAYIFADYGSGRVWQMRYETNSTSTNITPRSLLIMESTLAISCFGTDPSNGDVLWGHLGSNRVRRLVSVGGGYAISNAFQDTLTFSAPVAIVSAPGETNRLFIVEQAGRIAVVTNLASPNRTVFMDISSRVLFGGEQGLLGLAFHPGYSTNRYFYVFYTTMNNTPDGTRHDRLSRFEISPTNPDAGSANSELILLQQKDDAANHNAGDLHFGPDGYLYVSLGDEGNADDSLNNSQTITKDFFSAIMRLDVDNRPGSLMPNPHPANTNSGSVIIPPETLEETGIFSDLATLTPNPGIIPYDVNTPYWTDGAIKTRWFHVPTNLTSRITFRPNESWTFQPGTVWIQHFDLEMTNGIPDSRRPIETRVLVRDGSTNGHSGAAYRWDSPTTAVLVPPEGEEEMFTIYENGTPRSQTWRYPARAECLACHTTLAGRALGFNTPQLNRNFDYDGVVDNQIRSLANVNYFNSAVGNIHTLPVMARLDDESFGVQHRARSYLMANCAHCHRGVSTSGNFNARIYLALSTEGIIDGSLRNNLGDPLNRVIRPGVIENSMIYTRMASEGTGRMPPSDTRLPDQQALDVFRDWILALPNYPTFAAWQTTNSVKINIERAGDAVSIVYTQAPNFGFEVQWTTNIANTTSWRALNTPENRPSFPGEEQVRSVPDVIESVPLKAYRVRVYEP
jgi:glucose/arabinose dehydrogenase